MIEVDFRTMSTLSRETIVEDVDMLSDVSDDDDQERAQFQSHD